MFSNSRAEGVTRGPTPAEGRKSGGSPPEGQKKDKEFSFSSSNCRRHGCPSGLTGRSTGCQLVITTNPTPVARLFVLLLCTPGIFAISRYEEVLISIALAIYFFLIMNLQFPILLRFARTGLVVTITLILINTLLGPAPKFLNFFSLPGINIGLIISYRLIWLSAIAIIFLKTCPAKDFLFALNHIIQPLRITQNLSIIIIFRTVQLIPHFAAIRIKSLHHLPEMIAQKIATAEQYLLERERTISEFTHLRPSRPPLFKPADLLVLLPATGVTLFTVLLR